MARLILNPGSPTPREIQLKPGNNLIGRGFANDFKIEDPSVSGSHCQISVTDGGIVIKDLGSTNGTFVNRAPVQEATLQSGETVHLGGVEMVFYTDAPSFKAPPMRIPSPALSTASASTAASFSGAPISDEDSPPAAFVTPPAMPMPAMTATATQNCKFHPRTVGRYLCNKCHLAFCELCVTARAVGNVQHKYCRKCGTECVPLKVTAALRPAQKSFYAQIPGAFMYPVRGSGIMVLIAATIIFALLNAFTGGTRYGLIPMRFSWSFYITVLATGYFFSYMQTIIQSTAVGDPEMPPLPSMANIWEDVCIPCLQLLGLVAICFAPAAVVAYFTISGEDSSLSIAFIATAALGCLYFPMAFLAVAMLDSVAAANPLQVVPSILKVPVEYLVSVVLLAIVLTLRALGDPVLHLLFPKGLTTHRIDKLFAMFGAYAFWGLASLYLLTVGMHILGLLYLSKKDRLGWLAR